MARSHEATVNGSLNCIVYTEAIEQGRSPSDNSLQHGLALGGLPTHTLEEFLSGVEMALEVMDKGLQFFQVCFAEGVLRVRIKEFMEVLEVKGHPWGKDGCDHVRKG